VAGGTSFGVALALFASSRTFPLSLALVALAGCAMILNNALTNTLLQTLVPDELRGRVMGSIRSSSWDWRRWARSRPAPWLSISGRHGRWRWAA